MTEDGFEQNFVDIQNDDSSFHYYKVEHPEDGKLWLAAQYYEQKQTPNACTSIQSGMTWGQFSILGEKGEILQSLYILFGQNEHNWIEFDYLEAGTYYISLITMWDAAYPFKDVTIKSYSHGGAPITELTPEEKAALISVQL